MRINDLIKQRRIELNLTLKEVANALGVAESTVSRYETSDIQNMGIDKIEALARVLQCSPSYLMGWDHFDEKYNQNGDLAREVKVIEDIQSYFGKNAVLLVKDFATLNELGQSKATEYISDLADQPKYLKTEK